MRLLSVTCQLFLAVAHDTVYYILNNTYCDYKMYLWSLHIYLVASWTNT